MSLGDTCPCSDGKAGVADLEGCMCPSVSELPTPAESCPCEHTGVTKSQRSSSELPIATASAALKAFGPDTFDGVQNAFAPLMEDIKEPHGHQGPTPSLLNRMKLSWI